MTLRTRILLGYGYLIGLLLLSVSVAAINSQRVAGNAKQILERSIRSLTQGIEMLEQLERQDSETLLGLLHPTTGTRLDDAERAFEAALMTAKEISKASAEDDDGATLDALHEDFDLYKKARADLLSRVYDDPLAAAEDYSGAPQKAFQTLKADLSEYVGRKTEALKHANDEASRSAIEGAVLLGVMVTVALLSLGFLSRSLQRDVLGRLTEVGHVTEAIAAGDRRRRVRDFYQDELGLVARQLNAALDRQQELESQMQGRLLEQRRVLVGLLNRWPTPAAMIGIDGEVVASTLTPADEAELHRLTPLVRVAAKTLMTRRFVKAEELAADIKASDGKRVVQIRALASGDNQIAGWLAAFVLPRTRVPEPSGVFPVAAETSDVFTAAPETSGVRPMIREPSGLRPATIPPGALRPLARQVSGPIQAAMHPASGPMQAAMRPASGPLPAAPPLPPAPQNVVPPAIEPPSLDAPASHHPPAPPVLGAPPVSATPTVLAPPPVAPQVGPPASVAPPNVAPPTVAPPNVAPPNVAPPPVAPPPVPAPPVVAAPTPADPPARPGSADT